MPNATAKDKTPTSTSINSPDTKQSLACCSISYIPTRNDAPTKRRPGRPRTHWTKSNSSYNRRRNRNRLRRVDVEKLKRADAFAARTRRRLETFVTVRWLETAEGEDNIQRRWTAFLNKLRNWMLRRGIALCYVYVHENPPHASPGFNSHLLVNVPTHFRNELTHALQEWFVGSHRAVDVQPRSVPGHTADERLAYMLKGTDKATATVHRLMNRNGWDYDQGVVEFKRCGVSNNLSATARNLWGAKNEP